MFRGSGQISLQRLAWLAGLLLLAAQTHALQHVHADADDTPCAVCAASLQDDAAPTPSEPTASWPTAASVAPPLATTRLPARDDHPARARAPPPISR